jgi:acyl carrier protein
MTPEQAIQKLRDLMKTTSKADVEWDKVTGESKIATLGFDSLSILDLTYDIQQEFKVEFDAEELIKITTVRQLAEFLISKGA